MLDKSKTKQTKDSKEEVTVQEIEEVTKEAKKEIKEAKKEAKREIEEALDRAKQAEIEKEELRNLLIQVLKAQSQSKVRDWLNIICWIICFALLIIQALNR